MKKRLYNHRIAIMGIVLAFLAIASSCGSMPLTQPAPQSAPAPATQGDVTTTTQIDVINRGIFGEAVIIPVKDFQTLGLVFTEHVFQLDALDADVFTYQALLKEAKKLNADAIINVTIDRLRQTVNETTREQGASAKTTTRSYVQETWYGSALAIKYTTVLPQDVTINVPREPLNEN